MADNPIKKQVRLYYLGGLDSPHGVAHVQSRGKAIKVPRVGEYITVALYNAQDLIQRSHNGIHSAWSLSERDGQAARRGDLHREPQTSIGEMSIEQLEAILAEKRAESGEEQIAPPTPENTELDLDALRQMAVFDSDEEEEPSDEDESESDSELPEDLVEDSDEDQGTEEEE
jgi:hypothetical protein